MAVADRIPELSDKELEILQANAVRLKESGTVQQQRGADELLPLLDAAMAERRAARAATQAETRRVSTKKKKAETP